MKCKRVKRDDVFLKFVDLRNRALYSSYKYPDKIKPGYITPPVKRLVMCQSGWHFTNSKYFRTWINDRCYVVVPIKEYIGINNKKHYNKGCSRRLRFISELKPPKGFKTWIRWRNGIDIDMNYNKIVKNMERRMKRALSNYRARNRK